MTAEPQIPKHQEQGRYVTKPRWWIEMIAAEPDLHDHIRQLAEKRATELSCFGGE